MGQRTLSKLEQIIHEASSIVHYWRMRLHRMQVSKKPDGSFVTEADVKVEEFLVEQLGLLDDRCAIVSEESGQITAGKGKGQGIWLIDPLDGTNNFMHGMPHCAICVAKIVDGRVEQAAIYDIFRDVMYYAKLGKGAYNNYERLRVRTRTKMENRLLLVNGSVSSMAHNQEFVFKLAQQSNGLRRTGSVCLDFAQLANGYADLVLNFGCFPWDYYAGSLILSEAGGCAVGLDEALSSEIQLVGKLPPMIAGHFDSVTEVRNMWKNKVQV